MYNSRELLSLSAKTDWALPHFNVHNPIFAKAVLQAAKECSAPVVLAVGYQALKYISLASFAAYLKQAIAESQVKAALHFDHAKDIEIIKECIDLGFSSIMFDGSLLNLEENIKKTNEVVQLAKPKNISVEAEIGIVPTPAHGVTEIVFTEPEKAKIFYEETKVDFLAVSLGSIHGGTKPEHNIDMAILKSLNITVPFVMHGASGVNKDSIQSSLAHNIRKININTALKVAAREKMAEIFAKKPETDILESLEQASVAVKEKAKEYIYLLNAQNIIKE